MYSPPPGYADLLSDAEDRPATGVFVRLEVPEVGTVLARKPGPTGVASLAMSGNPSLSNLDRTDHMVQFVSQHLDDGELERLYFSMMVESGPTNSIERAARALATWGTARPYVAVVTLCVMTGYHWRTMRHKLLSAGIIDPLSLVSMHALLDFTEATIIESMSNGEHARRDITTFHTQMYGPSGDTLNGDYNPVPAGFAPDEVEDSFDAFARAAR